MISENALLKLPQDFKGICNIYPPSVNEVITNKEYRFYIHAMTMSQEEIEDEYIEKNVEGKVLTPIEYMLASSYSNKEIEDALRRGFEFFLHEPVRFLYDLKIIVIGGIEDLRNIQSIEQLRMIKEKDFFDFQNCLREAIGEHTIEPPNPDEDPRVKRIKAKARYRDKIKAKKGLGLKLSSSLLSICCMGFGLNPLNIGEISYASISALIRYYQEKDKYETDIDSLLAGADSKKIKPKYWIRNIDD